KVSQIIMTSAAAITIRATIPARPGYGASSSLRKSRNQDRAPGDSCRLCAIVAILNLRELSQRRTRRLEIIRGRDFGRGPEPDTSKPNAPNSGFAARPEGRVQAGQRHPDQE